MTLPRVVSDLLMLAPSCGQKRQWGWDTGDTGDPGDSCSGGTPCVDLYGVEWRPPPQLLLSGATETWGPLAESQLEPLAGSTSPSVALSAMKTLIPSHVPLKRFRGPCPNIRC